MKRLHNLEMVYKEVLRYLPIGAMIQRTVEEEVTINNGEGRTNSNAAFNLAVMRAVLVEGAAIRYLLLTYSRIPGHLLDFLLKVQVDLNFCGIQ